MVCPRVFLSVFSSVTSRFSVNAYSLKKFSLHVLDLPLLVVVHCCYFINSVPGRTHWGDSLCCSGSAFFLGSTLSLHLRVGVCSIILLSNDLDSMYVSALPPGLENIICFLICFLIAT